MKLLRFDTIHSPVYINPEKIDVIMDDDERPGHCRMFTCGIQDAWYTIPQDAETVALLINDKVV